MKKLVIVLIIILITSVALVGGKFAYCSSGETRYSLEQDTEQMILKDLSDANKIVIPISTRDAAKRPICGGRFAKFGVGVRNTLDTQTFKMVVNKSSAGVDCYDENQNDWIRVGTYEKQIPKGGQQYYQIGFEVAKDAKSCIYVYTVSFKDQYGETYGDVQKLYLKV